MVYNSYSSLFQPEISRSIYKYVRLVDREVAISPMQLKPIFILKCQSLFSCPFHEAFHYYLEV